MVLHGTDNSEEFTYEFSEGINFFIGKNDSGKTEFYSFIDYMFGDSSQPNKKYWFKDSLSSADLHLEVDGIGFVLTRYLSDVNKNFFHYADECKGEPIRLDEYKERLNHVFSHDEEGLRELRMFVDEDISYRTFTLFNFLGENRQGEINNFFDKCSEIKYSIKLPAILNYIFNRNLLEITELKKEEAKLQEQLEIFEKKKTQNDEFRRRTNQQLEILGIEKTFSGTNADDILQALDEFQRTAQKKEMLPKSRTIAELEAVYTSLDEQIKVQTKTEADCKGFEKNAGKQKELLGNLQQLISQCPSYEYLVQPVIKLTSELDQSISFSKYLIQENTTRELKKQRDKIRNQIQTEQSKYRIYSASDKTQAMTLIKDYLKFYDAGLSTDNIKGLKNELRKIREKIRYLQNSNDLNKIQTLSDDITRMYKLSADVSDLVEYDFSKAGFKISYIKNGNILQPQISESGEPDGEISKNYYTGSMARHTLIQLCGYLAFLRMLLSERKYPVIPILVIDHISKPFDGKNKRAIGKVLQGAYNDFPIGNLQILIFDDENPSDLGIHANRVGNLVEEGKSGFNPFYHKVLDEERVDDSSKAD